MNDIEQFTVVVGMSGGVDSSVAAALLCEAGHRVVGVTMSIWDERTSIAGKVRHACWGPDEEEDIAAARRVAAHLAIPFHVIDLRTAYREEVIGYVRREYLGGRTPNPCVWCNHRLKFGLLLSEVRRIGLTFDRFATGHYVQRVVVNGNVRLLKGRDRRKDQSYFLSFLSPEQVAVSLFPLGERYKRDVRAIARRLGLPVADRRESQDFIGSGDYSVLFEGDESLPGEMVDESGRVLGRHRGIIHYTVGQRRGLGIATGKPLYVLAIDAKSNRVIVTDRAHLFGRGFVASTVNWLAEPPSSSFRAFVRIRQTHREAPAVVTIKEDGTIIVRFDEPQLAITPGQVAVIYDGEMVVAGSIIEQRLTEEEKP